MPEDRILDKLKSHLNGQTILQSSELNVLVSNVDNGEEILTLCHLACSKSTYPIALQSFWSILIHHPFSEIFIAQWIKNWKHLAISSNYRLLHSIRLSYSIMCSEGVFDNSAENVKKQILKFLITWIDTIEHSLTRTRKKFTKLCIRKIHMVLRLPRIFNYCAQYIIQDLANLRKFCFFANILTAFGAYLSSPHHLKFHDKISPGIYQHQFFRDKLINFYTDYTFRVKNNVKSSRAILEAFFILIRTINCSEFENLIFPNLEDAARRDVGSLHVINLSLQIIVSSSCSQLIPSALSNYIALISEHFGLQSSRPCFDVFSDNNRILSILLEYSICKQDADRQNALKTIELLLTLTKFSDRLAYFINQELIPFCSKQYANWYERHGVFSALAIISDTGVLFEPRLKNETAVSKVIDILISLLEKEKNKESIFAGFSALINWIRLEYSNQVSKKTFDERISKLLVRFLTNTDAEIVRFCLYKLWHLFYQLVNEDFSGPSIDMGNTVANLLIEIVSTGKTKPLFIKESLLAFSVLQVVSSIHMPTREVFQGLYSLMVLSPSSILFTPGFLRRFEELKNEIKQPMCTLVASIVEMAIGFLLRDKGIDSYDSVTSPSIWWLAVQISTSDSLPYRRAMLHALKRLTDFQAISSDVSSHLLKCLVEYLKQPSNVSESSPSQPELLNLFLKIVVTPRVNVETDYPKILMLAHHPFVIYNPATSSIRGLQKKMNLDDNGLTLIQHHVIDYLFGKDGLESGSHYIQLASRYAISFLLNYKSYLHIIISKVCSFLSLFLVKKWLSFPISYIGIFHTPEGHLYKPPDFREQIPEFYPLKPSKQNNASSTKKGDSSINKQQNLIQTRMKVLEEEQLASESSIRKEVASVYHSLISGLDILELAFRSHYFIFINEDASMMNFLFPILDSVVLLARHQNELQQKACSILSWSCKACLHQPLAQYRSNLVHSIIHPGDQDTQSTCIEALKLVGFSLNLASWAFFQPVVINCLIPFKPISISDSSNSTTYFRGSIPLQQLSMQCLKENSRHVNSMMMDCLLQIIHSIPSLQDESRAILTETVQALSPAFFSHSLTLSVLLDYIFHQNSQVRLTVLDSMLLISHLTEFDQKDQIATALWISRFDSCIDNSELSVSLYKAYSSIATITENYFDRIWPVVMSNHQEIYEMAAKSMVGAMNLYPISIEDTIKKLLQLHKDHYYYEDDAKLRSRSSLSRAKIKEKEDWVAVRFRSSVVFRNFGELSTLSPELCISLLEYFETALLENDASTFDQFLKAGTEIIRRRSNREIAYTLIELFESKLTGSAPSTFIEHRLWEVNVIFLGVAVQHLQHEDARIQKVVSHLFKVLETPSEPVQRVVSDCLSQIVSRDHSRFMPLAEDCLQLILKSNSLYGHRRGGAWGLAGLVHGSKPISLKTYPSIMSKLEKSCRNRSDPGPHQGALITFECLSLKLKIGFEPWIIHLWNYFLNALSDPSQDVRNTAFEASHSVLLQLSPTGIQLVLPALLKLLDSNQPDKYFAKWNAIQLINALTQRIFRNLISFLPTIITHLSSLLIDPNYDIQNAAKTTMSGLCNMVQNSQIRAISTKLIMAIDDPDNHLVGAINALAENNYTEMVDSASLALIVLVVDRSIKNGKGDTKKMAIKMVGSICHLTDPKDFSLYYPKLCGQLIDTLNDPIPLNRMITAHTLGELSLKMNTCHSLSRQLMEMMNQSNSAISVGLSQGLAHVISHLNHEYVEMEILPRVESACKSEVVNIRGSFMSLFQFLPTAFGTRFERFLPFALPIVIRGLSDHQASVRDTALKSGQAIISRFDDNIDLILPHLEKAMLDPSWQTRANSLQLLEGLFHEFLTSASKNGDVKDYSKLLSSPIRCRILAFLYMLRFDSLSTVSKNAFSAWKTAVLNTGKTLRTLVPTFISVIVDHTSHNEMWDLVLRTVSELVQKMGDHVLVDIISGFEKKMNSLPAESRNSVCIDVSEILQVAATKAAIHESKKLLFPMVLKGLCDSEPLVRKYAVVIFDSLRKYLGESAIDEIFPKLIVQIDSPDPLLRQISLQGIQQILSFHAQHILPVLIPKLLQQPISNFNARALASVAEVSGTHLTPFLHKILHTLIHATVSSDTTLDPENPNLVKEALHSVILTINTSETLGILFTELTKFITDQSPQLRHASLELICFYATNNRAGQAWLENITFAIHTALKSYQDEDPRIVLSAIDSLATILSTINVEAITAESVNIVKVINDTIESLHFSEITEYLVYSKGLEPILKIYVAAMRNGSSLMREQASLGIRFLFSKSKNASLTPSMIQSVTGTLIRILSERQLESYVRSDILQTLNLVIDYGGSSLKHFSTTLQITYLKFISTPYKPIREQSAIGILKLISLNPNIPFLIKALITVIKDPMNSNPDSCLQAISGIFQNIGNNIDSSLCESMRKALSLFLDHEDFNIRQHAAIAFASTLLYLPLAEILKKVECQLLLDQTQNDKRIEAGLLTLYHVMKRNSKFTSTIICDSQSTIEYIILNMNSAVEMIRGIASQILALILVYVKNHRQSAYYAKILVKALDDESIDVKIMVLNAIRSYAKAAPEESAYLLKILVPPTLSNVKKNTLPLKCAAEKALYCLFQVNKGDALYRQFIENLNEAQRKQFALFYRTLERLPDVNETADCVEKSQIFL